MEIIVKPNKNKTEIIKETPSQIILNVKAAPEKGKANKEIIKFISRHFKKRVKIIKGLKSKKKEISFI